LTLRFRTYLIVAIIAPMLAAGSLVGWLSFRNTELAVDSLTERFAHEAVGNVTAELNAHLAGVQQVVELNVRQGWALSDLKTVRLRLFNQLLSFPTTAQIFLGTIERRFIGVERQAGKVMLGIAGWHTGYALETYTADRQGEPLGYGVSMADFDPRQQNWYKIAEHAPGTVWTEPYYNPMQKSLQIAAARPAFDEQGKLIAVYAAAMNLDKTSRFLRELAISRSGRVFIVDRQGHLIATSLDEPIMRSDSLFDRVAAAESRDPVVRSVAAQVLQGAAADRPAEGHVLVDSDSGVHHVEVRPYRFDKGIEWRVVIAIPEADLIGQVRDNNSTTLLLLLALTLPAVGIAVFIAHRIDVPVRRLSHAAGAIAAGRLDERIDIARPRELASLGDSFNAMAARLKASFQALEDSRLDLERRVEERTRELDEQNAALIEEIHLREAAEQGIRRERDFTRRVINSLPGIFFLVDTHGQEVMWNTNLETVTGFEGRELSNMSLYRLFDEDSRQLVRQSLKDALSVGHAECEAVIVARDGRRLPFHIKGERIEMNGVPRVIGIGVDITQRKMLEDELRRLATTDDLTGIAARGHFLESAAQEIQRSQRYDHPLSVMMVDIDHFKAINDTHGHAMGDLAIQKIVGVLKQILRAEDLLGRLGGEEFGILLPETGMDRARTVAERIREQIATLLFNHEGNRIVLTVSIGLTEYRRGDAGIDAVLLRADTALYEAKRGGRNRTVCRAPEKESGTAA